MKTYVGVDVQTHIVLILALIGYEWSASRPARPASFTLVESVPVPIG
jgi:hypothetical protein